MNTTKSIPSDPGDPRGSARHYLGHGCPKDKAMEQQVFYRTMRVDGLSIFHREAGPKDTLSGRCLSFNRHWFRGLGYCPVDGVGRRLPPAISAHSGKQKPALPLCQPAVFVPTECCEPLRSPQSVLESACRFPRIETCCASRCLAVRHELAPHL